MKLTLVLVAFVMLVGVVIGVVACMTPSPRHHDGDAAPIFGIRMPLGYRDWN